MKSLFLFILSQVLYFVNSIDLIFLIDTSKSIFMFNNDECNYNNLIRNFTSELVYNLEDCNLNYASIQYNLRGYTDYEFSNNNTYVYNKMKHYEFNYGAPTLIHKGLEKIVNLYDLHNNTNTIYLILLTDGETLNKDDFHKILELYPFNSSELNNILIKIGTYVTNDTVFEDFIDDSSSSSSSSSSNYNHLNCGYSPLNDIINEYDFCDTSTTTTIPNETITTTTIPNETITTTIPNETITTTTIPNETITTTTTPNEIIITTATPNETITITTTIMSNITQSTRLIFNLENMLIMIVAGIMVCVSIFALFFLGCNKPNKVIKKNQPENIDTDDEDDYNYNNKPRIIYNSLYDPLNIPSYETGEYIEVNGGDNSSLDDNEDINESYKYLKYRSTQFTDF